METSKRVLSMFLRKNHMKLKQRENNFIKNGSLSQQEFINFCNGKNLPIRVFSAKEVMNMSDYTMNNLLHEDSYFQIFSGVMNEDDRIICIKKFYDHGISFFSEMSDIGIVREIVLATQMSVHGYALKLLGCCLETDVPVLVYEFPEQGCLADKIFRQGSEQDSTLHGESLPWRVRLRISSEIAYALAYLQNGFRRPVIFRNLSARDVFIDKDGVSKLSGFFFSVMIPEGQVHVDDAVIGTTGFSDPEYSRSGRLTEKTDVYMLGMLLFELIAGRRKHGGWYSLHCIVANENHRSDDMITDPAISKEVEENGLQQQLQEVHDLALKCIADNENDRPSIVDVASELKRLLDSCELSNPTRLRVQASDPSSF